MLPSPRNRWWTPFMAKKKKKNYLPLGIIAAVLIRFLRRL
jgi:hypothetical protein